MKKTLLQLAYCLLLTASSFLLPASAKAQILCITCYSQNDSISDNVNNLLLNGGFENHNCTPNANSSTFCPNSSNYQCDIINWTCTGGGINTYSIIVTQGSISYVPEGIYAPYFGNNFAYTCSPVLYDTSCLNKILCVSVPPPVGFPYSKVDYGDTLGISLQQTVTGLIIGNTYVLEFWVGGEASSSSAFPFDGLFAVDIGFGKTFLRNHKAEPVTGIGKVFIIQFNATSTSHTIKFTNWGHICFSCTELVLDNVRLYTLAELDASVAPCYLSADNLQPPTSNLVLSPNPAKDILNISLNSPNSPNYPITLSVIDIMGKQIFTTRTTTENCKLQTVNFPKGMYFVNIVGEKINEVAKFVKE